MAPAVTERRKPQLAPSLIQQYICGVSFSKSVHPVPTELHVTAHELVFRSFTSSTKATATCIARVPFCCIFGYQAPAGTVCFSEKETSNQHQQQQECVTEQDRQVVVHYLQLTKPDLNATTKLSEVRIVFESLEELLSFTRCAVDVGAFPKPRRVRLLINPKGGTGQAKDIAETIVKPMFKHSGHQLTEQYTEYAKHAIDIAKCLDLESTDTLATISGDGVLHELINGLLSRPDWDNARRRIQLALISAGSGNAIATSIGTRDRRVATLALIRGQTAKTDVYAMAQCNRPRIYSLLLFTWGMMADSDLESDRYRWLGGLRFEIAGFMRIFRLRRYPGKVYIYPTKDEEPLNRDDVDNHTIVRLEATEASDKKTTSTSSTNANSTHSSSPPMKHEHLLKLAHEHKQTLEPGSPPPPSPWKVLPKMPFYTMFLLLRQPYVNETLLFCRDIKMNDGLMWVWYSCETRFWRIVKPFIMDQTNGKMIESGLMDHVKCGALLIEPGIQGVVEDVTTHQVANRELVHHPEAQKVHRLHMRPGYFDVDGEAIFTARTLIEVLPSFLDIIVPEWYHDGTVSGSKAETWKHAIIEAATVGTSSSSIVNAVILGAVLAGVGIVAFSFLASAIYSRYLVAL